MANGPVDVSTTFEGVYPKDAGKQFKGRVEYISEGGGAEGTKEMSGDLTFDGTHPVIGFDIGSSQDELLEWVNGGLK